MEKGKGTRAISSHLNDWVMLWKERKGGSRETVETSPPGAEFKSQRPYNLNKKGEFR